MTTTRGRPTSQASATCAGFASCAAATSRSDVEQRLDPAQVLGAEQRVHRPDPARPVVGAVPPAEQALGQRAVGDHEPVLALGERAPGRPAAPAWARENCTWLLITGRPSARVGLPPALQRVVGDARRADPAARRAAARMPGHDHRVGDHRVGLVHLVERDARQPQPPRAAAPSAAGRPAGTARPGRSCWRPRPRPRSSPERLAEDPLAAAEAVDLGGVEQRDAELAGAPDDVARGPVGVRVAVAPLARAELPGAQPDPADRAESVDVEILACRPVFARAAARADGQPRSRLSQIARPSSAPCSVARQQCTSQPATPAGPPEAYPSSGVVVGLPAQLDEADLGHRHRLGVQPAGDPGQPAGGAGDDAVGASRTGPARRARRAPAPRPARPAPSSSPVTRREQPGQPRPRVRRRAAQRRRGRRGRRRPARAAGPAPARAPAATSPSSSPARRRPAAHPAPPGPRRAGTQVGQRDVDALQRRRCARAAQRRLRAHLRRTGCA